jgi:hypothetical protein
LTVGIAGANCSEKSLELQMDLQMENRLE